MKISEHRAGVFKHMLSLLLTVVILVSVPGLGSFAAVDGDGTEHVSSDTDELSQDLAKETDFNSSSDSNSGNSTPAPAPYAAGQGVEGSTEGHTLIIDSSVGSTWKITYGDTTLSGGSVSVAAETMVKLAPNPESGTAAPPLTLTFKNHEDKMVTMSLDDLAQQSKTEGTSVIFKVEKDESNGSYTFNMPDKDVTVGTVLVLYLEDGFINLSPEGFIQSVDGTGSPTNWKGNYRILQDRNESPSTKTENVLRLCGKLTGQQICLGKLEISSNDSIELKSDNNGTAAEVELTLEGEIKAKNILVPSGAKLTINGKDEAAANPSAEGVTEDSDPWPKITLEPNADRAAIGGSNDQAGNGVIELNNVELSMTLTDGSVCSGIGPGQNNAEGSCGAVNIKDCKITVTDNGRTAASGEITRAWIGGAGVEVSMENTSLLNGDETNENSKYSSYALNGKSVTLTGCNIGITDRPNGTSGTDETNGTKNPNPIKAQIHAYEKLNIKDCFIYQ